MSSALEISRLEIKIESISNDILKIKNINIYVLKIKLENPNEILHLIKMYYYSNAKFNLISLRQIESQKHD